MARLRRSSSVGALEEGVVRPTDSLLRRERQDQDRHGGDRRLEALRLAHLQRGAAELFQTSGPSSRDAAGQGALLQVHHRLRLRPARRALACRGEPRVSFALRPSGRPSHSPPCPSARRSPSPPSRWSRPLRPSPTAGASMQPQIRAGAPGRQWPRGPDLRAQSRPPGHLARDGAARAHHHPHRRGPEGTGHNAAIPGYEVRGQDGHGAEDGPEHTPLFSHAPGILSFVAFAPVDDPRIAMIVLLDEPKNEKWGSEAARTHLCRHRPRGAAAPERASARHDARAPPARRGGIAAPGGMVVPVRRVSLDADPDVPAAMPALEGRSLRQAMAALAPSTVTLEVSGRGAVVTQWPAPGTPLAPGTACRLVLAGLPERPAARP